MKLIDILVEELPKRGGWPDGAIGAGFLSGEGALYFWDKNNDCPPKWKIDTDIDVEDSDEEVTREQYEAALAAKNDGWIDWGGGKHPPVSTNTVVDVKFKNGNVQSGYPAGEYSWEHEWAYSNIIAYRLRKPKKSEQVRADAWNAYAGTTEADGESDLNECIGQGVAPALDGLPQVGCVCERSWAGDEWQPCKILFTSNQLVVVKLKESGREDAYNIGDVTFRPICAEEDKKHDAAIKELTSVICGEIPDTGMATAAMYAVRVYDAGYRK